MSSLKQRAGSSLSTIGLGHLLVVYIIWSSTYLAIRILVAPGSGFSSWTAGSVRMVLAGLILLLYASIKKYKISVSRRELGLLFISGTLLWVGCNGLVMWAEQRANSGFAALVLASTPIWTAFIESMLDKKLPSSLLVASLLLSFSGISVLVAPSLLQGSTTQLVSGITLLMAAICWSAGSVLQSRYPINLEAPVTAAYQHLLGGLGFILIALISNQPWPQGTLSAWLALAYLIVFGSVIAFTSFIKALKLLPINIAMTYAYVNPVLALILGWWLLNEGLTIWTLVGAAMVILGVVGVFRDREQNSIAQEKAKNAAN